MKPEKLTCNKCGCKMEYENSWDAWQREWENAHAFFNCQGNVESKDRLKSKWNNDFMEMLKCFYEQAQTQTKLECLKDELEFLKEFDIDKEDMCIFVRSQIGARITRIQKEIQEIEK